MSPPPFSPTGALLTLAEAREALAEGRFLCIAGDAALLRQLPRGPWLGGSIPYFMGPEGGVTTRERLFVQALPTPESQPTLRWYDEHSLHQVALDAPNHGLTLLLIPAFSDVHTRFAREAPGYEDMYLKPLVGWVAGLHLDDLARQRPQVFHGQTLEHDSDRALALHLPLPPGVFPRIEILNLFEPGEGEVIRFPRTGFAAEACEVGGRPTSLAAYLHEQGIDTRWPLVADCCGAMVNVSFKSVDLARGHVDFYAPVFEGVDYRLARPLPDYARAFARALPAQADGAFWSCNCILNHLYGDLEGRRTGPLTGPMTFGEIAYQLLNQTLVYVSLDTP